jgi:hypothetical protein
MLSHGAFLRWIYNRLCHVYNESPNIDYTHRLLSIVEEEERNDQQLADIRNTYSAAKG